MTTETLLQRVRQLYGQECYAAALRLAQKCSAQALSETGEPSRLYAEALQNEAECLWAKGRWDEAMACSEKAMAWAGIEGHGRNALAARCLSLQARMRRSVGQAKEAKNLFIRAGNILYQTAMPDDDDLVQLIRHASEPLVPVETKAAAVATGKRACRWACGWYPDSSGALLLTALAESYAGDERWTEAATIRSFILQRCRAYWGSCHPHVLAQIDAMAEMAEENGNIKVAEAYQRKALKILAVAEGRHSETYAGAVDDLLDFYRKHGMKRKALALGRWKLRNFDHGGVRGSDDIMDLLYSTACLYRDTGVPKEALDLLRKGDRMHLREREIYTFYPDQALFRMQIGLIYLDLGQRKRAIRMLQSATDCLGDYDDTAPDTPPAVYESLGWAYFLSGKIPQALQAWERVLRWLERYIASDTASICRVLSNCAIGHVMANQHKEAKRAIDRAYRLLPDLEEVIPTWTSTADVKNNAGVIYRLAGKYVAACRMLDEAIAHSTEKTPADSANRVAMRLNRAETFFLAGKKEKALADYEAARVAAQAEDGSETVESKNIARTMNLIRRDRYHPANHPYTLFPLEQNTTT